jgi:hypothetical protein
MPRTSKLRAYTNFKKGLVTAVEDISIPPGSASNSLNWLTSGDKIELVRGRARLGVTENVGLGKITGLHVARMSDGTEIPYRTRKQKVEYYDSATDDWVEVGTNILPAGVLTDAYGEDISFHDYASEAGNQMFINSPNGDYLKFMIANPGSYCSVYDDTKNFKGFILIKQNRTFLWGRTKDKTGIYGSYIDSGTYTTVTAEATLSLSGTLAFKAGGAKRTCFGIIATHTVSGEVFTDDYNGNLVGSLGNTGTINYMSGAYTFSIAGVGLVDYQWEDSNAGGISDFTMSGTRTAGQGFIFRQDDGGGDAKRICSFGSTEYCFHQYKTWALTLSEDDTNASNPIYRHLVGIPNWKAAIESGKAIYYIDDVTDNSPRMRKLTFDPSGANVVPMEISLDIDLTGYLFDKCSAIEWNDYLLFACRTTDSTNNNRVFAYDRLWGSWDILDYNVSHFAIYEGTLIAGDSLTDNVYTLFSGVDDDEQTLNNIWEGWNGNLELAGLKKVKMLRIEGEIGADQNIEVYAQIDSAGYALVGTIEGSGDYVDKTQSVAVGAYTLGRGTAGGGGDGIDAYHYIREFRHIDWSKADRIKLKFVATDIGYASVSGIYYMDIRQKGLKAPYRFRQT